MYRTFVDRNGTPIRQSILSITATGNQRHVIVPGVGPVLGQAGRFAVDPETGSLTAVHGLNIPAGNEFCAALTP